MEVSGSHKGSQSLEEYVLGTNDDSDYARLRLLVSEASSSGQNGRDLGRHLQMHFLEWKLWNTDSNFMKLVARIPTDNKPALVQVMTWRRTGDKPLPVPMMIQFTDAYMRH